METSVGPWTSTYLLAGLPVVCYLRVQQWDRPRKICPILLVKGKFKVAKKISENLC